MCPAAIAVKYSKRIGTSRNLNGLTGREQPSTT